MSPAAPGGPLGQFLTDPGGFFSTVLETVGASLAASWPWFAPITVMTVAGASLARTALLHRRQRAFCDQARLVTILAPPTVPATGGEVLWAQLSGLLRPRYQRLLHGQPHVGFEYAWSTRGLVIRLWLPGSIPTALVRRAVEAAWPGAHTTLTDIAAPPFPATYRCTAGTLRLARPEILPLRTDHAEDPLRALLQAATGMSECEHALVQVLARPATGARLRRAKRGARRLKAGRTAPRLSSLFRLFAHAPQRTSPAAADPSHGAEVRQSVGKLTGPQWEVTIRYAVALPPKASPAERIQARLRGRSHAIASAFSLYSARNWLTRHRLRTPHPVLSNRHFPHRGDLLSVPELAALAHLPVDPDAPGLARAGARSVAPPPSIPSPGPGVKPLGHTDTGTRRGVGLAVPDARHHLHLTGSTGSGKSTFIAQLVLDDVAAGRGAVVIDPKGDLITDLLHRLPAACADRLVVIDPDDTHAPPCLNVRRRHRRRRRQHHRHLPPHLHRLLGPPHRRHHARRLPHPPAPRADHQPPGHPRRHSPPPGRVRLPPAHDPHHQGPRPARLLDLVRVPVRAFPRRRRRPGHEQTARLPAALLRPPGHRLRRVHLPPERRP
ncbi:type IV secretion system DNA-binding domain-containing protein [Streptomyces sp. ISL-100]|uniref:type IV secretion system DNA-binding domain-containing protein n=1 Tax=Streptomyces sp. ISL-100 TaxID=2819173 RepID=UPI0027E5B1F2|nr:type IV secretion system DNA-binding domain-containing protein [Streptomyces sp. ISL-100]